MKAIAAVIFMLFAQQAAMAQIPNQSPLLGSNQNSVRTPVEITAIYDHGKHLNIHAKVNSASSASQLLVFTKNPGQQGYSLATSIPGDPALPRTRDLLPSPDSKFRNSFKSSWWMNAAIESNGVKPTEVYVVAVEIPTIYADSKDRDIENIRRLPLSRAQDFSDVLASLKVFGWTPTGYTKGAP
jgi:hypothetical protein